MLETTSRAVRIEYLKVITLLLNYQSDNITQWSGEYTHTHILFAHTYFFLLNIYTGCLLVDIPLS